MTTSGEDADTELFARHFVNRSFHPSTKENAEMADEPAAAPAEPEAAPEPATIPVAAVSPEPEEPFDKDRAMATIHKQRDEAKALKAQVKELSALKVEFDALKEAQMSEQEKQAARLTELEAEKAAWQLEKKQTSLRLAIHNKAAAMQIADADLALAALDKSQIDYTDDGEPTNLDELLTALLEAKPLLKGTQAVKPAVGQIDGGAGRTTGPAPALTAEELAAAAAFQMNPDKYAAMKDVGSLDDFKRLQEAAK